MATARQLHRERWGPLVAFLARTFRDLDLAEDGVQEAYAAALARWPREGIPDQPGAWLLTVARNRALDRVRRNRRFAERMPEIRRLIDQAQALGTEPEEAMDHQLATSRRGPRLHRPTSAASDAAGITVGCSLSP